MRIYLNNTSNFVWFYSDVNFNTASLFLQDDHEYKLHNNSCTQFEIKPLEKPNKPDIDPVEYHQLLSSDWHMPDTYKNLDVLDFCCKKLEEKNLIALEYVQILNKEYKEFKQRNMIDILKFMCYIMDQIVQKDIVTGVGRGSSVSSLVLYLIGVHHIDPVKYNLSYKEFLRWKNNY